MAILVRPGSAALDWYNLSLSISEVLAAELVQQGFISGKPRFLIINPKLKKTLSAGGGQTAGSVVSCRYGQRAAAVSEIPINGRERK